MSTQLAIGQVVVAAGDILGVVRHIDVTTPT
jgi:hypothetical protein